MKIVINKSFGGFSLSPRAIKRLAELNGKPCYFTVGFPDSKSCSLEEAEKASMFFSAWTVPGGYVYPRPWHLLSAEDKKQTNEDYAAVSLDVRPEVRTDPKLIQVVEELGAKASGRCADLAVIEIPDGVDWVIDEYDGLETVHEKHRSWS